MKNINNIYSRINKATSVGLILALLWLTISLPIVFAARQSMIVRQNVIENTPAFPQEREEEPPNPLSNTTEEKVPTASSGAEEYLFDNHFDNNYFVEILCIHKCEDADTYIAYHGKLHVPPPNAL